jgi:Second Messenger Oligonucleotide or Dinucleotide Synthetase domain
MNLTDYLEQVLQAQRLAESSEELKDIRKHRDDVEALLRSKFQDCSPTICYGGSVAKKTRVKDAYDLDIVCYFAHDDDAAGENLKEIYDRVKLTLAEDYHTEPRTSAIRLKSNKVENYLADFHIDVVPGRFTDETKSDCYIHQSGSEKSRLKTNIDVHIKHIRDSEVIQAIRLFKLWNVRNGIWLKTFVMELLVIELLKEHKDLPLGAQFEHVLGILRDDVFSVGVEDPANPSGNDLSAALDDAKRLHMQAVAASSLSHIDDEAWTSLFGEVEVPSDKAATLASVVSSVGGGGSKPWSA